VPKDKNYIPTDLNICEPLFGFEIIESQKAVGLRNKFIIQ
jgi:acetoacetate decarboxylase